MLLGMSAGLSPGPLSTLVITETLVHNIRAGIKVAMAPLITDLPIIALCVFVLSRLSGFNSILGIVSLVGGVVVLFIGFKSMQIRPQTFEVTQIRSRSLSKGVLVNFLSPHPYLFWLSVGAPIVAKAAQEVAIEASIAFLVCFYLMLVGSKVGLAILIGRFKQVLKGRAYILTMRVLGLLLCFLALFLFKDGLTLLQIIR
jgi:threonine/homoserine/homoserine lactone efflux protein